jgi:hypothetical protein
MSNQSHSNQFQTNRFPPLAPQSRLNSPARSVTRALPQISLPWLEIGLTVMLSLLLRLG